MNGVRRSRSRNGFCQELNRVPFIACTVIGDVAVPCDENDREFPFWPASSAVDRSRFGPVV